METTPRLRLSEFDRDWIDGVSGHSFYRRVLRRVHQIRARETPARQHGVLIVERDPISFAAALCAAIYLQVPVILANPQWRRAEWSAVANQVRPAFIFGRSLLEQLPAEAGPQLESGTILIPTGGTSGRIKFAVHTWEGLLSACPGVADFLGGGPVNACCTLPLYHVSGLMQLVRTWATGGRLFVLPWKDLLGGMRPNFRAAALTLSLVPTQLQRLLQDPACVDYCRSLRAIFIGGASLHSQLAESARAEGLPLVLSYGMTETAAMVAALPAQDFLSGASNAGRALPNVKLEVVQEDGRCCAVGQAGRIRVSSPALFRGYHARGRTLRCEEAFTTDDEGVLDAQGYLHVLGRSDRIVNSGGEKIDPLEVETVLLESGYAKEVLVLGWPDVEWGEKLIAFYTPSNEQRQASGLNEWLRAHMVDYKRPKVMICVEALPVTANGKLEHDRIQALLEES